jgi:starch-binding outer membrane protein, SusD/RagB family
MMNKVMTRIGMTFAVLGLAMSYTACDPNEVLDVTDPDILETVTSADGALALRNGVFLRFAQATTGIQGADAIYLFAGLLTDEWRSGDTFVQRNNQDQRIFDPENSFNQNRLRDLNRVRVEGKRAIAGLRKFAPDSVAAVAQIFALTALAEVVMAENYCNGTPLSELDENNDIVYGKPLSNNEVFQIALQHADSALAIAPNVAAVANLAKVVKGRALIDLGKFAEAATAVTGVPLTFAFQVSHSLNVNDNQIWALNVNGRRYTMVDKEGGVGLDYVSSNDPRLPKRTAGATVFDNSIPVTLFRIGIWDRTTPVTNASGIEAELMRAEADLKAGNTASWLTRINGLRTNTSLYPVIPSTLSGASSYVSGPNLTALADPGSQAGREDIMFRERAFWMFSTGHRLGDMRRLLRQYGRAENTVFPNGVYYKGGNYGNAVSVPVAFEERNNPEFQQCLDTKP